MHPVLKTSATTRNLPVASDIPTIPLKTHGAGTGDSTLSRMDRRGIRDDTLAGWRGSMSKVLVLLMVLSAFLTAADLNIYLVDVEGGQSTLIVAPSGESLLIDTGIAGAEGRDPKRIFDLASNVAHLKKIDYLLITHYHGD